MKFLKKELSKHLFAFSVEKIYHSSNFDGKRLIAQKENLILFSSKNLPFNSIGELDDI